MADLTLKHLDYCTYCPKMCRHACPVSTVTAGETYIPQAKMAQLNLLRDAELRWDQESTDPLWACTACGHCTSYCRHGVQVGPTLMAGRAEAARRGVPHPSLDRYPEHFRAR